MKKWQPQLRKEVSDWLRKKLESIPHTYCPWKELYYHPVAARLKNGQTEHCVVIFAKEYYLRYWGNDPKRPSIDLFDIEDVFPSSYQMPPRIAFDLYEADETRMGGLDFSLTMKDGRRLQFCYGGIKDFVKLPDGYTVNDIQGFEIGRDEVLEVTDSKSEWYSGPEYKWCLYNEDKKVMKRVDLYPYPYSSAQL